MKRSTKNRTVDCLGLGIIPLDHLVTVPRLPDPGGKVDATGLCIQGGGPIPNCLTGLSRLGLKTFLVTGLGDDMTAKYIRDELKRENIGTHIIAKKRLPSDSAYGFVEEGSGRRTIVLSRKMFIKPSELKTSAFPIPKVVHLDGRDLDACIKMAKWGRKVGAIVSFDVGSLRNDVSPIFPMVDQLIVSDAYALGFTRKRTIKSAIKALTAHCPGTIVVTQGIEGSTAYDGGTFYRHSAFKVKSVDTTGAGDSFHAGYLCGLIKGFDMPERLRYGAAVAALKCMKPGARAGNPTLRELNRFLKSNPAVYA